MPVADVYFHYVNKVERKDRTEAELIKVITWLTGFDSKTLKSHLKKQTTFNDCCCPRCCPTTSVRVTPGM